jgi:hypothetical protein
MAPDGRARKRQPVRLSTGLEVLWTLDRGDDTSPARPPKFTALAFDPSGDTLTVGCTGGLVTRHRSDTGALLELLEKSSLATCLAIDPAGRWVASGNADGSLTLWGPGTDKPAVRRAAHGNRVRAVAFDHTGQTLASVGGGPAKLWASAGLDALRTLESDRNRVMAIAFHPTQPILAVGGSLPLGLWRLGDGSRLHVLDDSSRDTMSVAFSPRGKAVAAGGADGAVRLWDTDSGERFRAIALHEGSINAIQFSHDGRLLAFRTTKGAVHIHRCDTWEPVAAMTDMDRSPILAFHPRALLLATGSGDELLLVRVDPDRLLTVQRPEPQPETVRTRGRLFISYVEEDAWVAQELARELEARGYRVWYYQRDSNGGPSYLRQVSIAISDSDVVLVIISADALRSHQIAKEVALAHEEAKAFLPLLWKLSHDAFKAAKPDWRMAVAASTTLEIPAQGPAAILPRIDGGLVALRGGTTAPPRDVGRLIYASERDQEPFAAWTRFSTAGTHYRAIRFTSSPERPVAELEAFGPESVGINLALPSLSGRVELELQVESGGDSPTNLFLYAIPMRGSFGGPLLELGAEEASYASFPHRRRSELRPTEEHGWRRLLFDFDFRPTYAATYSILGIRINEGCIQPRPGLLRVGSVKVWSLDAA